MRNISVFAPLGCLDHQTGILNAIECFASEGYYVDVLAVRNKHFPEVKFERPNIRVHYMPFTFSSEREPRSLVTLLFSAWVLTSFWRRHQLIFAGGIRGLFSAYFYSLLHKASIINYQTELYIDAKLDTKMARLFKYLEKKAVKQCMFTIEHDEQRRDILCKDLGLERSKVLVVPNAPFGPGKKVTSYYLHENLGIDGTCKIILNPGSIGEAFASSKVVRISQELSDNWRCVVHSAQELDGSNQYINKLKKLNIKNRVIFSLTPVPYLELESLMASADIGLVLYSEEAGQNTSAVGLASGKLSHFLKLGVPVIVSDLPGLSDFVLMHEVGVVLREGQSLREAVEIITSDIEGFCQRCVTCFDQELAYEKAFSKVVSSL